MLRPKTNQEESKLLVVNRCHSVCNKYIVEIFYIILTGFKKFQARVFFFYYMIGHFSGPYSPVRLSKI